MIKKTKHNKQEEQQELAEEENYLGDSQYEQERFTDTYNEDFTDDYDKEIGSPMTIMKILQIS
jgi:hypothetical protein